MVALEAAFFIEDRRPADAGVPGHSIWVEAGIFEIAEGLAGREHRLVLGPGRGHWRRYVDKLPAGLAKECVGRGWVPGVCPVRQVREPQVLVLLPVPVGRKLGQAAEAGFALAQFFLHLLALGDVAPCTLVAFEVTLLIEDRRAADAQITSDAVRANAAVFEVAEGLTSFKDRLVFPPRARQQLDTRELPPGLTEPRIVRESSQLLKLAPRVREAQV